MPVDFMTEKIYKVDYTHGKGNCKDVNIWFQRNSKIYFDKLKEILKARDGFVC